MIFNEIIKGMENTEKDNTKRTFSLKDAGAISLEAVKKAVTEISAINRNSSICMQLNKENFQEIMNDAASADREKNGGRSEEFYQQILQLADDLYDCIVEIFEQLLSECEEKYIDEEIFSSYDAMELVDASDYGDGGYDYERQSKAKAACKEAVNHAVDDLYRNFKKEQDAAMEKCHEFLDDMDNHMQKFMQEFQGSYDDYVSLDCEDETKAYAVDRKSEITDEQKIAGIYADLNVRESFVSLIKELFDDPASEVLSVQKYFAMCTFDEEDGCYCYDMEDAVCSLNADIEEVYEEAQEKLEERMMDLYRKVFGETASAVLERLTGLFRIEDI